MSGPFVIAEAGVNHNGSFDLAIELVDVAAAAGADAVKFQTFSADRLASADASLAEYQRAGDDDARTQYDLLKGLELSHDEFVAIRDHCIERGITFLSTGFDLDELRFLIDDLHIPMVKIASGDLTFAPLLVEAGASGLPVILSTGMADLAEIAHALQFIAAGYAMADGELERGARIDSQILAQAWAARDEHGAFGERVTVLHCTTEYPAEFSVLNLRAMSTIAARFGTRVGYSDHSLGALASTVAVSLGATVIEKHFTLDKAMEGPDHAASLDPRELIDFVTTLRNVETVLGSPIKQAQSVELGNRDVVRRSLVAARPIARGSVITAEDVVCRRPADGRTAFDYWEVVGTVADHDVAPGDHVG